MWAPHWERIVRVRPISKLLQEVAKLREQLTKQTRQMKKQEDKLCKLEGGGRRFDPAKAFALRNQENAAANSLRTPAKAFSLRDQENAATNPLRTPAKAFALLDQDNAIANPPRSPLREGKLWSSVTNSDGIFYLFRNTLVICQRIAQTSNSIFF